MQILTLFSVRGKNHLFPFLLSFLRLSSKLPVNRQIVLLLLVGMIALPTGMQAQLPGDCASLKYRTKV